MESVKRQNYVDFLVNEYGYEARVTPWGIYIEYPTNEGKDVAVIKWRVTEKDIAKLNGIKISRGMPRGQDYAFMDLATVLHTFTGIRGTMYGASMRIEEED